jgi:Domain of unknown function (DUF4274)
MILEKLQHYSGRDLKTCEEQLAKRNGNFWFAMHDLLKPTDKDAAVAKLYTATDAEELHAILTRLKRIYACSDLNDAVMKAFDADDAIFESHKLHGISDLNDFEPEPGEMDRYAQLLRSFVPKNIVKALEIVGRIRAVHFTPDIIDKIKSWLTGTNTYMIKQVFDSNICYQPDKADLLFEELVFNLQTNRSEYHFDVLRALKSLENRVYPELTATLQKFAKARDTQIGSMANDLLVRYGNTGQEEREAADSHFRDKQVAAIHKKVNKLRSAKGLHNFANRFDWDEDMEYMFAVIRHEKCEVATAKMVYWSIGPTYFQQYASAEEVEDINRDAFILMTEIEQRMSEGKYTMGKLTYDPTNDLFKDKTKSELSENEIKRTIPQFMY